MKVFVCFVETGEYSDRMIRPLHAYRTEKEAQQFVDRSDILFKERWVQCHPGQKNLPQWYKARQLHFAKGWHPECPDLGEPDYTGFSFCYNEIEVKD